MMYDRRFIPKSKRKSKPNHFGIKVILGLVFLYIIPAYSKKLLELIKNRFKKKIIIIK